MEPYHGLGVPLLGCFLIPSGSDREIGTNAAAGSIKIAQLKLGLG